MGFLRPVPMVKIGLVGLKADREPVVSLLHDLGVVQVEPLRKEALELLPADRGGELQRTVSDGLLRFRTLTNALPRAPAAAPMAFPTLDSILAAAAGVPIDAEVSDLKKEEDRLLTERREVDDTVQLLERHRYYTGPLGALRSPRLLSFFGEATGEAFATLQTEVRALGEAAFVVGPRDAQRMVHFLVAVPREQADAVGRIAQQAGVHLASLPAHPGSIAEEVPLLVQRRTTIDLRLGAIRDRLAAIAAQWGARVVALEEAFEIENRKFEAGRGWAWAGTRSPVEGWVPKRHYEALERALRAR
ncbi:V-type ATPase 116kDa subunit family protein, partial [mine drainage metagenome]